MNIMVYLAVAVMVLFIYIKYFKPKRKTDDFRVELGEKFQTIDDKFNAKRKEKQQEIDRVLEKINREGIESLTAAEKAILDKNAS